MEWNTPRILKAGGAAVTLTAALLMLAAIAGARSHRHEIQVIGRDSAPSIVAAQHIGTALADMDAAAAEGDFQRFEARRVEAVDALIAAAENITYGDAERAPIRKLAVGLGAYAAMVQEARDKHDVALYRQAENFVDANLLPQAAALAKANRDALEETWARQKRASQSALSMAIAAGILLGGVLIALQVFIAQRMRRTLNLGLFGATLAAWVFVAFTAQSFNNADRDLKVAKEDAFDSILSLWQARSLAYAAHGEPSRALVDPSNAPAYRKEFDDKDAKVAGYVGKEINNITFAGEREAAAEMKTEEARYRALERSGQHQAANLVFAKFDDALGKTLRINQDQFEAAVERGFQDVANFEAITPVAAAIVCALAWLGLWPRLREYSL